MSVNWTPLADLIETHDRFLVTTHVRPDGDALGSEVGMAGSCGRRGRTSGWSTPAPRRRGTTSSIPTANALRAFWHAGSPDDLADREVAIILDLSAWNQLGDMAEYIRGFPGPRVVIDHHVSQDDLGATFLKDTSAEATGILVMRAVQALGATLTREVATGL